MKSLTPYSVSADFSASARTSSRCRGRLLRYDSNIDSYHSDISENRLKGAPKHGTETIFDWNARYAELDDYYNEEVLSADKHWFGKVGGYFTHKPRSE